MKKRKHTKWFKQEVDSAYFTRNADPGMFGMMFHFHFKFRVPKNTKFIKCRLEWFPVNK